MRKLALAILCTISPLIPAAAYTPIGTPNAYMVENTTGTTPAGAACYEFQTNPTCSAFITGLSTGSLPSSSTAYIQNSATPTTATQVFSVSSGTVTTLFVSSVQVNNPPQSILYPVEVNGDIDALDVGGALVRGVISTQISANMNSAHFAGRKARGTPSAPLAVQSGDDIVSMSANPYDGSNYLLPAQIRYEVSASTPVSTGLVGVDFVVTTGTGTPADGNVRMRVDSSGYVIINNADNTNGTLYVNALPNSSAVLGISSNTVFATGNFTNNAPGGNGLGVVGNSALQTVTASSMTLSTITVTGAAILNKSSTNACGYLIGSIVQTAQLAISTSVATTGGVYTSTGPRQGITPVCSSDKIKITALGSLQNNAVGTANTFASLFRGVTNLDTTGNGFCQVESGNITGDIIAPCAITYLDSPATTSLTTYSVQVKSSSGSATAGFGGGAGTTVILLEELAQ